jgi:hypothetical protein
MTNNKMYLNHSIQAHERPREKANSQRGVQIAPVSTSKFGQQSERYNMSIYEQRHSPESLHTNDMSTDCSEQPDLFLRQ